MEERSAGEWGLADVVVELSLAAARTGDASLVERARLLRLSVASELPTGVDFASGLPFTTVHKQRAQELRQAIEAATGVDPLARRYTPSHLSAELNAYVEGTRSSLSAAAARELDDKLKQAKSAAAGIVASFVLSYIAWKVLEEVLT